MRDDVIRPVWPEVPGTRALVTTSAVGNLASHTGDQPQSVHARRAALQTYCGVGSIVWLDQVHGTTVVCADDVDPDAAPPRADAAWTSERGIACAVLTADCVPILVADREARVVGIAHGGWRGLANGVIEALLDALPAPRSRLTAWLGPAIDSAHYEVGADVADAIAASRVGNAVTAQVLQPRARSSGKWLADLPRFAALRLDALGVRTVVQSGLCTFADARFYSHRRDKSIGRIASLIWRE